MTCRVEPVFRAAAGPIEMLHRACFPEDPWDLCSIEQMMSLPGFFGRIGWDQDIPAGFALALDLGAEWEILSLGVLSDYRRAGIGSALLDSICIEARLRGAGAVLLEVAVNNDAALALYTSHGFTAVGHRRHYYRQAGGSVDALLLRCPLAAASMAR
jgi:[ribosomal protein S18]-alanine N-acetyltransferase